MSTLTASSIERQTAAVEPPPHNWLRTITAAAASLYERLDEDFAPLPLTADRRARAGELMSSWQDRVAAGDAHRFARRLAADGISEERIRGLLAGVELKADACLPGWVRYLAWAWDEAQTYAGCSLDEVASQTRFLDRGEDIGFAHWCGAFVSVASVELVGRCPQYASLISEGAWRQIHRELLEHLAACARNTLYKEFAAFRATRQSGGAWGASASGRTRVYTAFLQAQWTGGMWRLWLEYPALGRLLARKTEQWVEFMAAFLRHWQLDRGDVARMLGDPRTDHRIDGVRFGLSDRHCGGKTSLRVRLDSGSECIYKPKNLLSEQAYYSFLTWLNRNGSPAQFRIFSGVYHRDRGWCEVVRAEPCESEEGVRRYFARAGATICLAYVLRANDLHFENLIAAGEYPALIDLESFFQARPKDAQDSFANAIHIASRYVFQESVVHTMLLPRVHVRDGDRVRDPSGIGSGPAPGLPIRYHVWLHPNTDEMALVERTGREEERRNLARLATETVYPERYVEDIAYGFRAMYWFFLQRREDLLGPQSPLRFFDGIAFRYILRDTMTYGRVLERSLWPAALRSGVERSIEFDVLSRALLEKPGQHHAWPLLRAEHYSLTQGDIPLFGTRTDSDEVFLEAGDQQPGFFTMSPGETARRQIAGLSEQDLQRQSTFVVSAFSPYEPVRELVQAPAGGGCDVPCAEPAALRQMFRSEALWIAEDIEREALRGGGGTATWIAERLRPGADAWEVAPMEAQLFDGIAGTAVFLASIERATGETHFRPLAEAAVQSLLGLFDQGGAPSWLLREGAGAGMGISSLVYAFALCHRFLDEPRALAAANLCADLLTPERIASAGVFDLLQGAAGAIPALLALYEVTADGRLLQRAKLCGDHLLVHRERDSFGSRAWPASNGRLPTGFSHGVSGIASSLCRLTQVCGDPRYSEAAKEAFAYEDGLYLPETGNWAQCRLADGSTPAAPYSSWCHGAPGIGLGRVLSAAQLPELTDDSTMRRALAITASAGRSNVDFVCCGNFGRAEILAFASERLGDPGYLYAAQRIAVTSIEEAQYRQRYAVGKAGGPYNASFFQGTAGIGYTLLRLHNPGALPSVLALEYARSI